MSFVRETPLGDALRAVGLRAYLKFPEELDSFQLSGGQKASTDRLGSETASEGIATPVSETSTTLETRTESAIPEKLEGSPAPVRGSSLDAVWIDSHVVDWASDHDSANPRAWSSFKKGWVTFVICYYTFVVYSASAIFVPSFTWVSIKYGISTTEANLCLAVYVFGYGIGPLLLSPVSEIYYIGRNPPYLVSFLCFIIISVVTALVADKSFAALVICRFLQGYFGSPILASGGASVEDLYDWFSVPYAFIFWISSMYCGPAIGPLLAAYTVPVDWRWPLWQIAIIASPLFVMLPLLPETSPARILYGRAVRLRARTGNHQYKSPSELTQMNATAVIKNAIVKPFEIGSKDPAIRFVSLYGSLIYAIYYSFFEAFPLTYVGIYEMSLAEVCMIFLCVVIGCAIFGTGYFLYLYFWFIPQCRKQTMSQESRLRAALPTAFLAPVGLFLYGWTARTSIHWLVPTSGVVIYAGTSFVLFQSIICYVSLSYPKYVASLLACNFFFRSIWAAIFIMFSHPMYSNLGIGKGVSILGSLSILGIIGVWYLYYYGHKLRSKSTFAAS